VAPAVYPAFLSIAVVQRETLIQLCEHLDMSRHAVTKQPGRPKPHSDYSRTLYLYLEYILVRQPATGNDLVNCPTAARLNSSWPPALR
jgi:hypothetical protein